MSERMVALIVLNGILVVLLGCFVGLAYGSVINIAIVNQLIVPGSAKAWHMAHLECLLNGTLVIAGGAAARHVTFPRLAGKMVFWGLIVMAWTNGIASTLSAITGATGNDGFTGLDLNTLNASIFGAGVVATFVALIAFAICTFRTVGFSHPAK